MITNHITDHHIFVKIKPNTRIQQGGQIHHWPECSPPYAEHKGKPLNKTLHPDRVFLAKWDRLLNRYDCIAEGFGFKGVRERVITVDAFVPTSGAYGSGGISIMDKDGIVKVTYEDYLRSVEKIGSLKTNINSGE